jgi:hypothetical protein
MSAAKLPSVQLLVDEMVGSALNIPSVQASIARMDAALAKHLEAGAGVVDISPRDIDPDSSFIRDTQFLLNVLPKGFAELSGRKPDGTILQGTAFIEAFVRAARTFRGRPVDREASDTAVFYRIDLNLLRAAAAAPPAASAPVRRRARP